MIAKVWAGNKESVRGIHRGDAEGVEECRGEDLPQSTQRHEELIFDRMAGFFWMNRIVRNLRGNGVCGFVDRFAKAAGKSGRG
jgi:hypothetical protein